MFNGSVGALNADGALQVKQGDRVRLFVGNAGPNLTSSFHVIGEILDNVYPSAGGSLMRDVQTVSIPAGDAVTAEFRAEVPGSYTMVDHAIFRAFDKGANGTIQVTGGPSPLYADNTTPGR